MLRGETAAGVGGVCGGEDQWQPQSFVSALQLDFAALTDSKLEENRDILLDYLVVRLFFQDCEER